MTKFRLLLVLLCLGLLGAMPFVIGASKPDTAGDQRVSTVQGQTRVQRQLAAERTQGKVDPIVGRQMEMAFYQAQNLAEVGKYKEALAVLDELQPNPDKSVPMVRAIDELRTFLMRAKERHLDSQVR